MRGTLWTACTREHGALCQLSFYGNRTRLVKILVEQCRQNPPFCTDRHEYELERRRLAALKISKGDPVNSRKP